MGLDFAQNGGLTYGIDFRGGTLVYVRFAGHPPIDQIRKGLAIRRLGEQHDSVHQRYLGSRLAERRRDRPGADRAQAMSRSTPASRRFSTSCTKPSAADTRRQAGFQLRHRPALAAYLTQKDPLSLGTNAGDRYNQLAQKLTDARDKDHGGIVTNFDELKSVDGATQPVLNALTSGFSLGNFTIRNVEIVGPKVGAQLRRQAMLATLYALAGHVGIYCIPV